MSVDPLVSAKTPLIRIVDDNEDLRRSLEFMLNCEGYETVSFESAEAFLAGDRPSRLGCVILDLQMPGLTGIELFSILKMRGYSVPIIFLTGHGDIDTAVYTMREGACDFHQKPINPDTLLPAVARAIERDKNSRGGMKDLGDEIRRWKLLTEREEQIARMVASGLYVSRTIALRLGISQRTVEHYRASALHKLELKTPEEVAGFFSRIDNWKAQNTDTL
ncbi:MAG: response regulator [Sutterellaceae bacterium]|nr:response regulator [Sutterellaceae bacterium]